MIYLTEDSAGASVVLRLCNGCQRHEDPGLSGWAHVQRPDGTWAALCPKCAPPPPAETGKTVTR